MLDFKFIFLQFIFSLFFISFATPQEPLYEHYNIEDGLPSDEVYYVFQDSNDYIWFATEYGVSRFDGKQFENFNLNDGLIDNTIFDIYEDYKGRIWFISFSLKLCYYFEGEIHSYKYNDKLINSFYRNRLQNKSAFHVDQNDNIYYGIRNYGILKIDSVGNISQLNDAGDNSMDIFQIEDEYLTAHGGGEFSQIKIHTTDSVCTIPYTNQNITGSNQNNVFIKELDEGFILSHEYKLFKFNKDELIEIKELGEEVIWLSQDDPGELWVGTNSGVHVLDPDNMEITATYLKNKAISSVLKDHEGGHWFTSLSNGVFYTPNINMLHINGERGLHSDRVEAITIDSSEHIWLGYNYPYISRYSDGNVENIHFSGVEKTGLHKLKYDPYNDRLLMAMHEGLFAYDLETGTSRQVMNRSPLDFLILGTDTLWCGFSESFDKYIRGEPVYSACSQDSFCMRITSIYYDSDSVLYLGGIDGLWKYEKGDYNHMGKRYPDLYVRITDINRFKNYIVLSTRGEGLIFMSDTDYFKLTQDNGLVSNSIRNLEIEDSVLWAATNNGVSKILITDVEENKFDIVNLTTLSGLPYSQVNDIEINDSLVYVATPRGLTFFSKQSFKENPTPPKIYINLVSVKGVDTIVERRYDLKYNENYISVDFISFSYRSRGNVRYKYRLKGLDTSWSYSTKNSITYPSLSPGLYTFEVKAQTEDGIWSEKPAIVVFQIQRPFWRSWWFLVLGVLFITGIGFGIFYYRVKMMRKRNSLMNDINEYKQKILRQQMNPHFIFNTLNSIQYFLLDEDTTSSLTYLTKFAKLMRIVLDNSQHTFVPIEDEIRGLDLYMELEALRFEESFNYEIKIDDSLNTYEYKVPALLLQPYVENSIRHGLLHKKDKGFIKIEIKLSNNFLFCIIEDNGIGRKRAEEIKMSKGPLKKSLGSKITEDRIKVLNSLYSDEIKINYVDLYDETGTPRGTRVEISLPFIY
ncbi:MAG: two-component regulator propeller domain-containing protein [Bacteroidales bacterium]